MLIVLSGLPGVGKSTLARGVAAALQAVWLRIDSIEMAICRGQAEVDVADLGYRVAYALAADNLGLGRTVVADSVNPLEITRAAWRSAARAARAPCLEVEILCSDPLIHRNRVETRTSDVPGLTPPSWDQVLTRDYEPWRKPRLAVDTALLAPDAAVERIVRAARSL